MKYLLGVFETKGEAEKAFADWNSEYEKARSDMKAEMQQWSKQEQARLGDVASQKCFTFVRTCVWCGSFAETDNCPCKMSK